MNCKKSERAYSKESLSAQRSPVVLVLVHLEGFLHVFEYPETEYINATIDALAHKSARLLHIVQDLKEP